MSSIRHIPSLRTGRFPFHCLPVFVVGFLAMAEVACDHDSGSRPTLDQDARIADAGAIQDVWALKDAEDSPPDAGCPAPPISCLLRDMVAPYVDTAGVPGKAIGLVVGVARPGSRYVTGFGATIVGGSSPPDGDSIFEIASLTKVYTGYLLARAIQHNEARLTETIDETFGPNVPTYDGLSITLLDLVTHTSGLPSFPNNLPNPGPVNPTAGYTVDMLEDFLASYQLTWEPGTRYLYSNLGAGILGYILVVAGGEANFEALVHREVSTRYGLFDTVVHLTPEQQTRKLQGYSQGQPAPALDIGEPLEGGGALRSTGNEVLEFFLGAVKGDDPAWAEVMTPRRPSPHGTNAHTGFLLNMEEPNGERIYSKNGGAPGFTSQVVFITDPPEVVLLLSNTKGTAGLYDLGKSILEELKTFPNF